MIQREDRYDIVMPARIRWEKQWCAASVRNISRRGAMLRTVKPPPPGTYVDLELPYGIVTARSMWASGQSCGLRLQDQLDVAAILKSRGRRGGLVRPAPVAADPKPRTSRADLRAEAERSRRRSASMQFAIVLAVGGCVAVSVAWEVYKALSAPLAAIGKHM
jgi:hypothetical protein